MTSAAAKQELRPQLFAARKAMPESDRDVFRANVRNIVLDHARRRGWTCVAAYEPLRTEPGSLGLLTDLRALGVRVLVPVTLPDRDLDWSPWGGPQRLGQDAIADADAVLVPALAVDRSGTRLGRGGGSYDRALRRCAKRTARVALLFDDELVEQLPRDEWDEPVGEVVRPCGWTDLGLSPTV